MGNEHDKAKLAELKRLLANAETGKLEVAGWDGAKGDPLEHVELLRRQVAEYKILCGEAA